MTRVYLSIVIVALVLFACAKRPTIVDSVPVDSVVVSTPIDTSVVITKSVEHKTYQKVPLKISPIYYGVNAYKLTDGQLIQVARIAKKIKGNKVMVSGYADTTGKTSYNMALSRRRAMAVVEALVALGVDRNMITAVALGEVSGSLPKARKTVITIIP